MPWIKESVNSDIDYDLINLDFSKIKMVYITPNNDNKELWDLSIMFFGDEVGYIIYQGSQVECINIRNKLEQQLNPEELTPWN